MPRKQPLKQPQRPPLSAVGDAFRAVHACTPDGTPCEWPSCPRCFDGKHVQPAYRSLAVLQEVRTYRCKCCPCDFSDLTGTPLESTQAPLVQWAWLLMMPPDDTSLNGTGGGRSHGRNHRLRAMRARIQGHPFGARWKNELEKAGVTFAPLAAAQATAPKKLAKRAVGSMPKKNKQGGN